MLVPPGKAAGGYNEGFPTFFTAWGGEAPSRAFPSLCSGNTYCFPGYKSINGIKPSISRAVRGILKARHTLSSYMIFFGWYFESSARSRRGTTRDMVLQCSYSSAGSVRWADTLQAPEITGTKRVSGCQGWRHEQDRASHWQWLWDQAKPLAKQQLIALLLNLQCIYSVFLPEPHRRVINIVEFLMQLSLQHSHKCHYLILHCLSHSSWLIASVNDL